MPVVSDLPLLGGVLVQSLAELASLGGVRVRLFAELASLGRVRVRLFAELASLGGSSFDVVMGFLLVAVLSNGWPVSVGIEPRAPPRDVVGGAPAGLDAGAQSDPNASRRNAVACAIAARVAFVWLSALSSMKS